MVSAAGFETPRPILPSNYSPSLTEKTNILILPEMHKDRRNPLPGTVGKKINQRKTQVCTSDIDLLVLLGTAFTVLADPVENKYMKENCISNQFRFPKCCCVCCLYFVVRQDNRVRFLVTNEQTG